VEVEVEVEEVEEVAEVEKRGKRELSFDLR
jgi:hypothetical protein